MSYSSTVKQTTGTTNVFINASNERSFEDDTVKLISNARASFENHSFDTTLSKGNKSANFYYFDDDYQRDYQLSWMYRNQRINNTGSYLDRQFLGNDINLFSLSGESSISMANFNLAVSTPIQDSFAMFTKDNTLKNDRVYVGDDGNQIDFFGATVIPTLSDRVVKDVVIDVPTLPVGSKIDRLYSFRPVHFTGYLVSLHVTPSVMLMGKLLNENKRPIKYIRGYVRSPKDPTFEERFLTSRSGIFQAQNLSAGTYLLEFGRKPYETYEILIPDDVKGYIE